jgi:hypothetical protein
VGKDLVEVVQQSPGKPLHGRILTQRQEPGKPESRIFFKTGAAKVRALLKQMRKQERWGGALEKYLPIKKGGEPHQLTPGFLWWAVGGSTPFRNEGNDLELIDIMGLSASLRMIIRQLCKSLLNFLTGEGRPGGAKICDYCHKIFVN